MTSSRGPSSNNVVLFVTASVIMFCLMAAVAVVAFIDDPSTRITLAVLMVTQIPVTAGLLRVLVTQEKQHETVQHIEQKTDQVLNGEMDAKIQAAIRRGIEERWGKRPEKD